MSIFSINNYAKDNDFIEVLHLIQVNYYLKHLIGNYGNGDFLQMFHVLVNPLWPSSLAKREKSNIIYIKKNIS